MVISGFTNLHKSYVFSKTFLNLCVKHTDECLYQKHQWHGNRNMGEKNPVQKTVRCIKKNIDCVK